MAALPSPRVVWVMVPAGEITDRTVAALGGALQSGDVVIDGGNSYFKDDVRRAGDLSKQGVRYVDVGTRLVVEITPGALRDLELRQGQQVYAVIKSTSILVLDAPSGSTAP